jgi:hypothetical protein
VPDRGTIDRIAKKKDRLRKAGISSSVVNEPLGRNFLPLNSAILYPNVQQSFGADTGSSVPRANRKAAMRPSSLRLLNDYTYPKNDYSQHFSDAETAHD